uniref:B9 domain-containing protein 2 n=1 Tax=Ascaris lumbricoides TaxID=6252 RepID=A0A0M3ID27_ASCLU
MATGGRPFEAILRSGQTRLVVRMAEVHVIGQIESATAFPDCRLFCKWNLQIGGGWRVVEGETEGQTQTDLPEYEEVAYFSHPIDVHLSTKTMQGEVSCQTWRPKGGFREEMMQYFLGGGMQLSNVDTATRADELMKLRTVTMGSVKLRLSVITRHFDRFGIQC